MPVRALTRGLPCTEGAGRSPLGDVLVAVRPLLAQFALGLLVLRVVLRVTRGQEVVARGLELAVDPVGAVRLGPAP